MSHHPAVEELSEALCRKTQNSDTGFFRVELAYFLCAMASCMRVDIATKDRGVIPVNAYAIALAPSGSGKNHSVNLMEDEVLGLFRSVFLESTMPQIAEEALWEMATAKAVKCRRSQKEMHDELVERYERLGPYPFVFDSGTAPAVKQLRSKLLLCGCGSLNYQMDELGSNLLSAGELLNLFLELYDQGLTKVKLIKNTSESPREDDSWGKTPANMLLFGTPSKLFDGGETEKAFASFLDTGYARRCFFGMGSIDRTSYFSRSPEELYRELSDPQVDSEIAKWRERFGALAGKESFKARMEVPDEVGVKLLAYRMDCEKRASEISEYEETAKAEMQHRYFKALKLMGAYAFIDGARELTLDHLDQAVEMAEESGECFRKMCSREKPYMKLAKYIASAGKECTHSDLAEALPFYRVSFPARKELMDMATAWGYRNHMVILRNVKDSIELFSGKSLEKTDMEKIIVSFSKHYAFNYESIEAPFKDLLEMLSIPSRHWANHWFHEGHRAEKDVIPGANLIVLDVDEGVSLDRAKELLADYAYIVHTTKRSTDEHNRFRLLMPLNYKVEMDAEQYKQFVEGILEWLPFPADPACSQRSKKWETYPPGHPELHEGKPLDALPFIPYTSRNEEHLKELSRIESLGNLERWFVRMMAPGNRNNLMFRYGCMLLQDGASLQEIASRLALLNGKLANPLPPGELKATVLKSLEEKAKFTET